jgi:hypothetical protein
MIPFLFWFSRHAINKYFDCYYLNLFVINNYQMYLEHFIQRYLYLQEIFNHYYQILDCQDFLLSFTNFFVYSDFAIFFCYSLVFLILYYEVEFSHAFHLINNRCGEKPLNYFCFYLHYFDWKTLTENWILVCSLNISNFFFFEYLHDSCASLN